MFLLSPILSLYKSSTAKHFNSDSYYNSIIRLPYKIENYISLSRRTIDLSPLFTNATIQPNLLGRDVKEICKIKGIPAYAFKEKNVSIYVFRLKLNEINTRITVNFYKNESFLINFNYPSIKPDQKKFIIDSLSKKYLNEPAFKGNKNEFKIVDGNNNIIFMNDVLNGLEISYLTNQQNEWHAGIIKEVKEEQQKLYRNITRHEEHFYAAI